MERVSSKDEGEGEGEGKVWVVFLAMAQVNADRQAGLWRRRPPLHPHPHPPGPASTGCGNSGGRKKEQRLWKELTKAKRGGRHHGNSHSLGDAILSLPQALATQATSLSSSVNALHAGSSGFNPQHLQLKGSQVRRLKVLGKTFIWRATIRQCRQY